MHPLPDGLRFAVVGKESAEVFDNLVNHYLYDMAEWFGYDSAPDGTYTMDDATPWATDHQVYFAYVGTLPVGFALIRPGERFLGAPGWDMEEFFIMRRYRRCQVGHTFAHHVWRQHPGRWIVRVFVGNRPALPFWHRCVSAFTAGAYEQQRVYRYERHWDHLLFDSVRPQDHSIP